MDNLKELKAKIEHLEYRLGMIEKYLDQDGVLLLKHDESAMNNNSINVMNDMKKSGSGINSSSVKYVGRFYNGV